MKNGGKGLHDVRESDDTSSCARARASSRGTLGFPDTDVPGNKGKREEEEQIDQTGGERKKEKHVDKIEKELPTDYRDTPSSGRPGNRGNQIEILYLSTV